MDSLFDMNHIDQKAHEAATSPLNENGELSQHQKDTGHYKKGEFNLFGLNIAIENPEGSVRSGTSQDGTNWQNTMSCHYGYIKDTLGADGDELDVFVKPRIDPEFSGNVYVIKQVNQNGEFDEHKVVLGADDAHEAKAMYLSCYSPDWDGFGSISTHTIDEFKSLLVPDEVFAL